VGKFTLRLIVLALLCPATHTFCQDMNPPIYSEVIPTSSGLPYDPATDTRESFQAPNGKTVEVLVKGPAGWGTYTRAIAPRETPHAYFPAVVSEAMKAGAHHLVIPKGVYTLAKIVHELDVTFVQRPDELQRESVLELPAALDHRPIS
jgi:hypothetical protein